MVQLKSNHLSDSAFYSLKKKIAVAKTFMVVFLGEPRGWFICTTLEKAITMMLNTEQ